MNKFASTLQNIPDAIPRMVDKIERILLLPLFACNSYIRSKVTGYKIDTIDSGSIDSLDDDISIELPMLIYHNSWPYAPYFILRNHKTGKSLNLHIYDGGWEMMGSVDSTWFPTEKEWEYITELMGQQSSSMLSSWTGMSRWDNIKWEWNKAEDICSDDMRWNPDGYLYGKYDDKYRLYKNYLPSTMPMPKWIHYDRSQQCQTDALRYIRNTCYLWAGCSVIVMLFNIFHKSKKK